MKAVVRPLISVAMAGTLIWGFVVGKIEAIIFVPIAAGVVGWWFIERSKEKKAEPPAK